MNDLITVNYDNEQPTILGRDLHKALEIKTDYSTWFKRMCEYDFSEGKDFKSCSSFLESEKQHGGQKMQTGRRIRSVGMGDAGR